MATRTAQKADEVEARAHKAWKHTTFPFISVDDGDVFQSGQTNITEVAWTPNDSTSPVAATFDVATGFVTLNCPGIEAGTLHIWSGGERAR